MEPEILVLLSGGIDSTACLDFYLKAGRYPCALFVDYGQPARTQERNAAIAVSAHYDVPISICQWTGRRSKGVGMLPARNAYLLTAALMERPSSATQIALGIHAGTNYPDCSVEFVEKMQPIFDLYTGGVVLVAAPFIEWTKSDILTFAKTCDVPLQLTYSCEAGGDATCGTCLSCLDRMAPL